MEEYSDNDFIIAMSGLYYLFTESYNSSSTAVSREQSCGYGVLCKQALEASLSTIGAFLPAEAKSVQALLLGVSGNHHHCNHLD